MQSEMYSMFMFGGLMLAAVASIMYFTSHHPWAAMFSLGVGALLVRYPKYSVYITSFLLLPVLSIWLLKHWMFSIVAAMFSILVYGFADAEKRAALATAAEPWLAPRKPVAATSEARSEVTLH
ncbi:hypothetical protein EON67_10630 [archaeon]|nr:MAG: hypothetical protein EON67_10630 [archaeon]